LVNRCAALDLRGSNREPTEVDGREEDGMRSNFCERKHKGHRFKLILEPPGRFKTTMGGRMGFWTWGWKKPRGANRSLYNFVKRRGIPIRHRTVKEIWLEAQISAEGGVLWLP